jgi:hypothetical protein
MFVVITNESKIIMSIEQKSSILSKNINQRNATVFTVVPPFTNVTLRQYKGVLAIYI